jgi:hypothetical protein
MSKKHGHGQEQQYASQQERNRAKQERHRRRQQGVTFAAKVGRARKRLRVTHQCIKCNGGMVCSDCQKEREETLATFKLSINRAAHLARNDAATGGFSATKVDTMLAAHERGRHGRSTTVGYDSSYNSFKKQRFTGRVRTSDPLQLCAEASVQQEQEQRQGQRRNPMLSAQLLWRDEMLKSSVAAKLRNQFPNLPFDKFMTVLWVSPEGKGLWKRITSGAPVKDSSPRCETIDELLHKGA